MKYKDKLFTLETKYSKQFNKYFKAMSYRIMSVEVEALYNILVLKTRSKNVLTFRHENNIIRI